MDLDRLIIVASNANYNHEELTGCSYPAECPDRLEIQEVLLAAETLNRNRNLVTRLLNGESI